MKKPWRVGVWLVWLIIVHFYFDFNFKFMKIETQNKVSGIFALKSFFLVNNAYIDHYWISSFLGKIWHLSHFIMFWKCLTCLWMKYIYFKELFILKNKKLIINLKNKLFFFSWNILKILKNLIFNHKLPMLCKQKL